MNNKICIYTICKNEIQFVDRWLENMKEADSIVVLDTGSTDGTYEYLQAKQKDYPQLIVRQEIISPWRFDVARNESMRDIPADCNILMSTDLDEILEPGWGDEIRGRWLEGVHERGIYLYSWSHQADGTSGRIFRYDKIHSRKWKWIAPVHEYLYNTEINKNFYTPEQTLDLTDTDIVHLHHYPDPNKSRGQYLQLLELRKQEMPEDWYGLIYLAQEYCYRGFYDKAINEFMFILDHYQQHYSTLEQASCYLFMGDSYMKLQDYNNAFLSYLKAINIEPTYREPYLNLAKCMIETKEYDLAIHYVKQGLKKSWRHYTWLERDTSWTWEPWDLLCMSSFYNGDKLNSIAYAAKALNFEPTNERLKYNLNICISLSKEEELY